MSEEMKYSLEKMAAINKKDNTVFTRENVQRVILPALGGMALLGGGLLAAKYLRRKGGRWSPGERDAAKERIKDALRGGKK